MGKVLEGVEIRSRRRDPLQTVLGDSFFEFQRLRTELRAITLLAGRLISGQKKFKSIYAAVQSLYPDVFLARWDGLFFSLWSSGISDALTALCNEKDGFRQALWTNPDDCDPIHHLYFLPSDSKKPSLSWWHEEERRFEELQSTILSWNLLPVSFALSWLLLIDIFNLYGEKTYIRGVRRCDPAYKSKVEKLRKDLSRLGLKKLTPRYINNKTRSYKPGRIINVFHLLPFYLGEKEQEQVFEFYQKFNRQGSINVARNSNCAEVKIKKDKVKDSYRYINPLTSRNRELLDKYFKIAEDNNYSRLVKEHEVAFKGEIPSSNSQDSRLVYGWFDECKSELEKVRPVIRARTMEKIREQIRLLIRHQKLIQWRFDIILRGLKSLAAPTGYSDKNERRDMKGKKKAKDTRIHFSFIQEERKGYQRIFPDKGGTIVRIKFGNDYFKEFVRLHHRKPYDSRRRYDSGTLTHIGHFFQVKEICKIVNRGQQEELQRTGGPIIV